MNDEGVKYACDHGDHQFTTSLLVQLLYNSYESESDGKDGQMDSAFY